MRFAFFYSFPLRLQWLEGLQLVLLLGLILFAATCQLFPELWPVAYCLHFPSIYAGCINVSTARAVFKTVAFTRH